MQPEQLIPIIISVIALSLSVYTAYRTFLAGFRGRVWFSNRIVFTHIDTIPSLGLACFFENAGAKPGILDDLRARIEPKESGTTYYFYPILTRNDYSIFKSYTEADWFPYSMLSLPPNNRFEKYILLKPQNDKFISSAGDLEISLEVRWYGKQKWQTITPILSFELTQEIADKWNDSKAPSIQVSSKEILNKRRSNHE